MRKSVALPPTNLCEVKGTSFSYYRFPEIANVYDKLISLNNTLLDGEFLLQTGWGTGYNANTVAALFTDDAELPVDWMDLRERFRLGESRSRRGAYDEREFPKPRRILYHGQNPLAPSVGLKFHQPIEVV